MNTFRLFCLILLVSLNGTGFAQENLKDLRSRPDSLIEDTPARGILIKPIKSIAPKLSLDVNYWKHWTKFGLNANQASFSDSWNGGGVNSISVGATANHKSDYNKDNFNFVTEFDFRYGQLKNKDQLAKKNNDRIFWDNKLSYTFAKDWSFFMSVTFESQFADGYKYKTVDGIEEIDTVISSFMAPGYITESLGLEYKPDKTFSLRFGTGTARQTLILDNRLAPLTVEQYAQRHPGKTISKDETRFGVEAGKKVKNDLAFQITANLDRNLSENLNLKTRYNLFANYQKISDPSHRLDVVLSAKVTKLVNVSLTGIMIYDTDVVSKIQYSEALALGLVYSLPR